MSVAKQDEIPSYIGKVEEFKKEGNTHFQKGALPKAIESYSLALSLLVKYKKSTVSKYSQLFPTILSNRALCQIKISEKKTSSKTKALDLSRLAEKDCTDALELLESISSSITSESSPLRAKILYRRAKSRFLQTKVLGDENIDQEDSKEVNQLLNGAARDLLDLLTFDRNNSAATILLRRVREMHGSNKTSPVSQAISELQKYLSKAYLTTEASFEEKQKLYCDRFDHLKMVYGHLCQDVSTTSMEIGRKDVVSILSQIACTSDVTNEESSNITSDSKIGSIDHYSKSRALCLQILSLSATYQPFALMYLKPNQFKQSLLFDIVSDCQQAKNADVSISTFSLFLRIVVAFHKEQALTNDSETISFTDRFVDGATLSRLCVTCLNSYTPDDNRLQKAALDLLSTWTSSDWEEIELSTSSITSIGGGSSIKKGRKKKMTESEIRSLPPKEFAAHRKKEYESLLHRKKCSKKNVLLFCGESMGGLRALLHASIQCGDDTRTRREIGLVIGRMLHMLIIDDGSAKEKEEGKVVQQLVGPILGYDGSYCVEDKQIDGLKIEEIYDDDDHDVKAESKMNEEDELNEDIKKAVLTSSLLLCNGKVGSWALSDGWSNGEGLTRLSKLIHSNDFVAMSVASELLSSVASVEKARPLLGSFVQHGYFESLLKHENGDVRSGAASAMAKLGLASKAIDGAEGEGEVMGLLQVASDLLYEGGDNEDKAPTSKEIIQTRMSIGLDNRQQASTATERGIELLSYLASKTLVKEELAYGFRSSKSPLNSTTLHRLVEMSRNENLTGDSITSYGIAMIFAHMAVSLETLRKEAFIGKDVTAEQYEELQSLAKTNEEKESAKAAAELEKDLPEAVNERIRKMASNDVPLAMVKLMDTCGYNNSAGHKYETTLEQLVIGMERMAIEPSVRGIMIQQGCLSSCIKIQKGDDNSQKWKKILRHSRHCISKILVTTNPNLLTSAQQLGSIGPMIGLVNDNESADLAKFEALLSITNVASAGIETKNRIISEKGIPILNYAMFSDHEMVRRAATEAMSNLIPHEAMMEHLANGEKLRLWVSFASDYEEHFDCAKAAAGCLAMASADLKVAQSLVKCASFRSTIMSLLECGNLDLMHRGLVVLLNLLDLKDPTCFEGVMETGATRFCEAYVESFGGGITRKMEELGLSDADEGMMKVTLDLAKQVVSSIG